MLEGFDVRCEALGWLELSVVMHIVNEWGGLLVWDDTEIYHFVSHGFESDLEGGTIRIPSRTMSIGSVQVSKFISSAQQPNDRLRMNIDLTSKISQSFSNLKLRCFIQRTDRYSPLFAPRTQEFQFPLRHQR